MDDIVTHLSFSRIRSFQLCSLKYYFTYVAKLKPAFTPLALAFGSAFHRAVEEALVQRMTGVAPAIDDLLVVFGSSLDESEAAAPIREGLRDLIETIGKPVRVGLEIVTETMAPVVERFYLDD